MKGLILLTIMIFTLLALPLQAEKPFTELEVTFKTKNITLAGTLTLPTTPGPHPAAVMLTASNADDRDETAGGFYKPFKIIAHYLAQNGIAVLRFDDRGIGKSGGKHIWQYTVMDYAADALSAIRFLKTRKDIDAGRIGLCGHSGGGMTALAAAAYSKDVKWIIALTTPVTKGDKTMKLNREGYMKSIGKTPKEIKTALILEQKIQTAVRSGKGLEALKKEIIHTAQKKYDQLPADQKKAAGNFDAYFANSYDGAQVKIMDTPFYRSLLNYEPAKYLAKIICPILIVFGETDALAPEKIHRPIYEKVLKLSGHEDYGFKVIPKVGHYFVRDWNQPTTAPDLLETIREWVERRGISDQG